MGLKYVLAVFIFLISAQAHATMDLAATGKCVVYSSTTSGNVVVAWLALDDNGNAHIQAAVGSVFTQPSTWTVTTISDSLSPLLNNPPKIFANQTGDVVVTWHYFDGESQFCLAASVLRHTIGVPGSWSTSMISDLTEDTGFFDESVYLDENGHILAIWTSTNMESGSVQLRGATATVSANTKFNAPVLIAPH